MAKITETRIGIACKNGTNAAAQAGDMAREAMVSANIDKADLVLAFCTCKTDPYEFINGIRSITGNKVPIIGGSAIGLISNNFLSYGELTAGMAIIQSNRFACRTIAADNIDKDENAAGKRLAAEMEREQNDKALLIFYDSVKAPPGVDSPPVMNSSSYLLEGISSVHAFDVPVIGAGLVGDFDFHPTVQFCGSSVSGQRAVGAMLSGDIEAHYCITHGCTPLDGIYHTITKVDGPVLYELDGRPVIEVINEMFGNDEWQKEHPVAYLTIGINHGDKYGQYREEKYVNRLITGVAAGQKGIVMFEPDLKEGVEIQFMSRDAEQMVNSARKNSALLLKSIEDKHRKPVFGLYIDCAGRAGQYSHTDVEEASEIQNVMNRYNVPFIGFYSGVEVAPFQGASRGLDWTGVLLVLSEG